MSREETKSKMDISKDDAKSLQAQGRSSQKARGQQPGSGSHDQIKLPREDEETLMRAAGRESQNRKQK